MEEEAEDELEFSDETYLCAAFDDFGIHLGNLCVGKLLSEGLLELLVRIDFNS